MLRPSLPGRAIHAKEYFLIADLCSLVKPLAKEIPHKER